MFNSINSHIRSHFDLTLGDKIRAPSLLESFCPVRLPSFVPSTFPASFILNFHVSLLDLRVKHSNTRKVLG